MEFVQTEDTRDEQNAKFENENESTVEVEHQRTDAPSSCGRGGAQP